MQFCASWSLNSMSMDYTACCYELEGTPELVFGADSGVPRRVGGGGGWEKRRKGRAWRSRSTAVKAELEV